MTIAQIESGRIVDAVGAGAIIASCIGYLPVVAAVVAMLWYSIQIWESRTVQHYLNNRKMIRKARKIARLRAKERVIVAELDALETVRQAKVTARDSVEIAKVEAAKAEAGIEVTIAAKEE